jgi:hypothetical protein
MKRKRILPDRSHQPEGQHQVRIYPPASVTYCPSGLVSRTFMVPPGTVAGTVNVVEICDDVTVPTGAR